MQKNAIMIFKYIFSRFYLRSKVEQGWVLFHVQNRVFKTEVTVGLMGGYFWEKRQIREILLLFM